MTEQTPSGLVPCPECGTPCRVQREGHLETFTPDAPRTEAPDLRAAVLEDVADAALALVGAIERGDDHQTVLRAASRVNQTCVRLPPGDLRLAATPAPERLDVDAARQALAVIGVEGVTSGGVPVERAFAIAYRAATDPTFNLREPGS